MMRRLTKTIRTKRISCRRRKGGKGNNTTNSINRIEFDTGEVDCDDSLAADSSDNGINSFEDF